MGLLCMRHWTTCCRHRGDRVCPHGALGQGRGAGRMEARLDHLKEHAVANLDRALEKKNTPIKETDLPP